MGYQSGLNRLFGAIAGSAIALSKAKIAINSANEAINAKANLRYDMSKRLTKKGDR